MYYVEVNVAAVYESLFLFAMSTITRIPYATEWLLCIYIGIHMINRVIQFSGAIIRLPWIYNDSVENVT